MIQIIIGTVITLGLMFLFSIFALLRMASISDDQMEQWAQEQKEKSQGSDQR